MGKASDLEIRVKAAHQAIEARLKPQKTRDILGEVKVVQEVLDEHGLTASQYFGSPYIVRLNEKYFLKQCAIGQAELYVLRAKSRQASRDTCYWGGAAPALQL